MALLLPAGLAQAGNLNFNGGAVASCTLAGSQYTCDTLALGNWNDVVSISSGYAVTVDPGSFTFEYNQGLVMSGSAALTVNGSLNIGNINTPNLKISGGTLTARGGTFSMGAQVQTIVADVNAAQLKIGTGSPTKVTGNLSATGNVDITSNVTVIGTISGANVSTSAHIALTGNINATGAFTLESGSTLKGNVVAASIDIRPAQSTVTGNLTATGSLTVGSNNTVNGNLVGRNVEIASAQAEVNGDVTASDTLFLGSNDAIYGDVIAGTVTLHAAKAYIGGNARVDWITLGNKGKVAGLITCNGGTAAAPCNCVTNNSHYDLGTPDGPRCVAPAPPPPPAGPHHIRITHDGTGLTCQPETVTLTACANAACTTPHYSGKPSVTLTPGEQSFVIPAGGVSTVATVRQTTPATIALKAVSSPDALNQSTCSNISTSPSSTSCNMAFADTGLELSIPNHVSDSAARVSVSALQASGNRQACVPLFAGLDKSISFACSHVNPSSGTRKVRVGASDTTVPDGTVAACGTGDSVAVLRFNDEGKVDAWLKYADVGQIGVSAAYYGSGSDAGLTMRGSTSVVVAPASFRFDAIKAGGTDNPAPADGAAAGPVFTKAGKAFSVTIVAENASGNPTPNFGAESARETVTFKPTRVLPAPLSPSSPDGPGELSGGVLPSFIKGTAIAPDLVWSEVGIIKITADLATADLANPNGYLGSAGAQTLDASGNVLTASGTSPNIGRFIPDHFNTAKLPGVPMSCSASLLGAPCAPDGLVYAGQEFGLVVTAMNAQDKATVNYSHTTALAKDTKLTGWQAAGGDVAQSASGDLRYAETAGVVLTPADFVQGESREKKFTYIYRDIPSPPSNVYFRAIDSDFASSKRDAATKEAGLTIVSGRMLIPNNYGSELLPMTINLRAQLRNAAGAWVTNTADGDGISGSAVIPAKLRFLACTKKLIDPARASTCTDALKVAGTADSTVRFVRGLAAFRLQAPGAGNNGSTNLQFLPPSIPAVAGEPANPSSVFLPSAPGQATFGIYKAGPVIYLRELH